MAKKIQFEVDIITKSAQQQLDNLTGGAVSGFNKLKGGIGNAVKGFKTLRGAIISTGIGALVVALGTLVTYFTNTQRGADLVSKAMDGIRAAFSVVTDRISILGESLIKFFQGDFRGAIDGVKDAFTGVTDEIIRETKAAYELRDALNNIKDEEIELMGNIFMAFGGYYGKLKQSNEHSRQKLKEIVKGYIAKGRDLNKMENDLTVLHKIFLYGISLTQLTLETVLMT